MVSSVIERIIIYCGLAAIIFLAVRIPVLKKKNKKLLTVDELLKFLLVEYIIAVLAALCIPNMNLDIMPNGKIFFIAGVGFEGLYNIIPFSTIKQQIMDWKNGNNDSFQLQNIIVNLIVLIPYPILLRLNFKKIKAVPCFFIILVSDVFMETLQYALGRVFDIDDIILNNIGALIGMIIIYTIDRYIMLKRKNVHSLE